MKRARCTSGTLALSGDCGYSYSLPIDYVYPEGRLFFHSALNGYKIDAIRRLSEKYNPGDKAGLEIEIKKYLNHLCMICLDVEHMIGKGAIELIRMGGK